MNRLRREAFRGVPELLTAIEAYVSQRNGNPKQFVWAAKANDILEKVKRGLEALESYSLPDALYYSCRPVTVESGSSRFCPPIPASFTGFRSGNTATMERSPPIP